MDISGTRFRGTQRRAHCAVKRAGCARRRARAPRQRRLHPEAVLQRRRGFRGSLRQGFPEDGAIPAGGGRSEGSAFRRSAGSWRGCRGARRGRAVPGSRSVSGRGAALGGPPRRPPAPPHAGWLPSLTDKKGFCFKYFSTKTASGNTEFLKTLSSLFDKKSGSALL